MSQVRKLKIQEVTKILRGNDVFHQVPREKNMDNIKFQDCV